MMTCQRCRMARLAPALDDPSELLCPICGFRAYTVKTDASELMAWHENDPRTDAEKAADAALADKRNAASRATAKAKRANESDDIREKRREANRKRRQADPEKYREYMRGLMARKRAQETPEERERRLAKGRERAAAYRAAAKSVKTP